MLVLFKLSNKTSMSLKIIFLLILLTVLNSISLFSHGINSKMITNGIGIQVSYDSTSPMSFAETEVFSPLNKETPFQEGFTDKNGSFVFVPDIIGIWKIIINDGLGHGIVKEIEIKDLKIFKQKNTNSLSKWHKLLIGLSFIFGITGIITFYQTRKALKGDKIAHS